MAQVFEDYLRNVLGEQRRRILPNSTIHNGNTEMLKFFKQGKDFKVAPDYYFKVNKHIVVILDAKYKEDPKRPDRYEMLSFCEATQCKLAVFILPYMTGKNSVELMGVTPSGIRMYDLRMDLGSSDILQEEQILAERLHNIMIGTI